MSTESKNIKSQVAGLPHILVETGDQLDQGINVLGQFNSFVVRPIAASQAFRDYNWILDKPVLNSVGNLRGMVIDADFKTVWSVSADVGDALGLAGIVIEMAKETHRMKNIYSSRNLTVNEKGPLLLFIGSAAILRGVTSVVPGAVHLASLSAQGYLGLAGVISGSDKPSNLANTIKSGDAWVAKTFSSQWDGANWYTFEPLAKPHF